MYHFLAFPHTQNASVPCFKALYLLAFFGFFRILNLVPISILSFHIGKQLCRGDVLFEQNQAVIIVKWSKTLQTINIGTYVIIPRLSNNVLCPVKALEMMFTEYPAAKNAPHSSVRYSDSNSGLNPPVKDSKLATIGHKVLLIPHI